MELTRNLRYGMEGEDVRELKERLLSLGCYAPAVTRLTNCRFGADTRAAVRAFQRANALEADGVVGPLTWAALFSSGAETPEELTAASGIPQTVGSAAAKTIAAGIAEASDVRRAVVLNALAYAYDPAVHAEFPISLYIRGGNLYNADLQPNVITLKRIASGAARQPEYYDGGRREMMERAVRANPSVTGADCSGGVVGLFRKAGLVPPRFDCSADGFWASASMERIDKTELLPGDLLHKSGHIGLYAGGGYAVEWMGGAYGCQLTRLDARRGWNFVSARMDRCSAWTGYLKPNYYET